MKLSAFEYCLITQLCSKVNVSNDSCVTINQAYRLDSPTSEDKGSLLCSSKVNNVSPQMAFMHRLHWTRIL